MSSHRLLAAALAAVLLVPFATTTADDTAPRARSDWAFQGFSDSARTNVLDDLDLVVPAARAVLLRIRGVVSFDHDTNRCHGGAWSCSYAGQGLDGSWGVHLDPHTTSATYPSDRFLVFHELGHAVWGLVLGADERRAFTYAVDRALGGRPCLRADGSPCAAVDEVFADEFARFAGAFAVSMSWYETPPLLDHDTFLALLPVPTASPGPNS